MAEAGYDLIITSFPPMSEATKVVAQEFPDTKFGAVYQFINEGEDKLPNVNSVEFKGNGAMFVEGYVAGLLTETNKLGFIIGGEEPGTNGEANGWMLGIATSNPNAAVEYANANSFEDTAKGKELASAMASNDVDLVHVIGSKIGTGVIEGAADAGIMADSDVNDYYEQYNGMVGYVGMGFDTVTYDIVKDATENNFKGGTHGIADITNGGYFMGWDAYERYANENADVKDKVLNAIEKGKEIEAKIISGEQEIPFDPDAPDFERAKASVK
jgi:basic membrane protein A